MQNIPHFKSSSGQKTFYYRIVSIWNSWKAIFKTVESVSAFKLNLNRKLFMQGFYRFLRADVCKYRPEVGKMIFLKNPQKIPLTPPSILFWRYGECQVRAIDALHQTAFSAAGLKCRSQATGQVTGYRSQATGQVTGHRPQVRLQVTGHRPDRKSVV